MTPRLRFTSSSLCGWLTSMMPSVATQIRVRGIGSGKRPHLPAAPSLCWEPSLHVQLEGSTSTLQSFCISPWELSYVSLGPKCTYFHFGSWAWLSGITPPLCFAQLRTCSQWNHANYTLMTVCISVCKVHQLRIELWLKRSSGLPCPLLYLDVYCFFCAGSFICTILPSTPTTIGSMGSTAAWLWSPRGCSSRWVAVVPAHIGAPTYGGRCHPVSSVLVTLHPSKGSACSWNGSSTVCVISNVKKWCKAVVWA